MAHPSLTNFGDHTVVGQSAQVSGLSRGGQKVECRQRHNYQTERKQQKQIEEEQRRQVYQSLPEPE